MLMLWVALLTKKRKETAYEKGAVLFKAREANHLAGIFMALGQYCDHIDNSRHCFWNLQSVQHPRADKGLYSIFIRGNNDALYRRLRNSRHRARVQAFARCPAADVPLACTKSKSKERLDEIRKAWVYWRRHNLCRSGNCHYYHFYLDASGNN